MSSEVDIRVRNLSKVYRIYERPEDRLIQMATLGRLRRFTEFPALHDITLDIHRGETVGIIGRNGCGKSTLLQLICGTLQPTSGTVEVTGRIAALLELGAGFNGEFTGRENVYMNGAILGFSREEMDARFDQIADFAGIGEFIERPVKTYSSGMFVRLAFAVATAVEPDILVVDEALAVGDEAFQRKCFARIEAIKERGGTILFVSHGAQTIVQLCDRAILMDGGEKLMDGDPKTVVNQYQRLINADVKSQALIRQEIASTVPNLASPSASHPVNDTPQKHPPSFSLLNGQPQGAIFDPALISESKVEYEKNGAAIIKVAIVDMDGIVVNEIEHGEYYEVAVDVEFERAVGRAGFGMMIKSVVGIDIGGQASHQLGEGLSVDTGEQVQVRFPFQNLLLPGVYSINVGVSEHFDLSFVQMHRVLDASIFRVRPADFTRPVSGAVNLVPPYSPGVKFVRFSKSKS